MAQQPDLAAILAALGQQSGGSPKPGGQSASQPPMQAGYPGVVSAASASNPGAGLSLPQPTNSGSLDLSSIKPVSTGSVSLADAIAKARGIAAEKASSRDDPRLAGRHRRSRSRSRSPARRESFRDNYNPYRDERRDDSRRGTNGRERSVSPPHNQSTFSPGRNSRGRDRSPSRADDNTEVITVDSSSVGLIIGRAGENLRRVEQETGARVQFMPDTSGPHRQCKISGTAKQRADAKRDIFHTAEESPGAPGKGGTPPQTSGTPSKGGSSNQQPALREGEKTVQIMVPDRTVGLIIGRGGETIRDLQERSGCHVNIVGENKSVNGLRPVNLIGSREAANKARELIMEVVDSDTRVGGPPPVSQPTPPLPSPYGRSSSYDPYAGGYDPSGGSNKLTDTVVVPSEAVGMIIGKGGETIKEMQNSTGCKINVSPPSGADINREIGLIGARGAIEAAKRAIWDKVGAVREKQGGQFYRTEATAGYEAQYPHQPPHYGQPPMPHAQAMPPPVHDQGDPYAAYGGYQNYLALWYAALANQGQGGPPPGP